MLSAALCLVLLLDGAAVAGPLITAKFHRFFEFAGVGVRVDNVRTVDSPSGTFATLDRPGEGIAVVNLTLSNHSDESRPVPDLSFALTLANGSTIGERADGDLVGPYEGTFTSQDPRDASGTIGPHAQQSYYYVVLHWNRVRVASLTLDANASVDLGTRSDLNSLTNYAASDTHVGQFVDMAGASIRVDSIDGVRKFDHSPMPAPVRGQDDYLGYLIVKATIRNPDVHASVVLPAITPTFHFQAALASTNKVFGPYSVWSQLPAAPSLGPGQEQRVVFIVTNWDPGSSMTGLTLSSRSFYGSVSATAPAGF